MGAHTTERPSFGSRQRGGDAGRGPDLLPLIDPSYIKGGKA
jgi:hypothetical protein